MESERGDAESRSSPMTSARDSLWRNMRMVGGYVIGGMGNHPPVSSTASVSNQNEIVDYLPEEPVIIHEDYNHNEHSIMIDRETESTLTEQEVKQIIEIYNKNIDECTQKNDEIRQRVVSLQSHLKEEEQRIYSVQQEISQLKHQQVSQESQIEQTNLQIQMLSKFKQIQDQYETQQTEQEKSVMIASLQEQLNQADLSPEEAEKELECLMNLERQVWILEQENKYLEDMDANLIDMGQAMKYCLNCKDHFRVSENNDQACLHHSGKLKFFSCKGCGRDEYYSCCWRCTVCQKGCRRSKHITEAD